MAIDATAGARKISLVHIICQNIRLIRFCLDVKQLKDSSRLRRGPGQRENIPLVLVGISPLQPFVFPGVKEIHFILHLISSQAHLFNTFLKSVDQTFKIIRAVFIILELPTKRARNSQAF